MTTKLVRPVIAQTQAMATSAQCTWDACFRKTSIPVSALIKFISSNDHERCQNDIHEIHRLLEYLFRNNNILLASFCSLQ